MQLSDVLEQQEHVRVAAQVDRREREDAVPRRGAGPAERRLKAQPVSVLHAREDPSQLLTGWHDVDVRHRPADRPMPLEPEGTREGGVDLDDPAVWPPEDGGGYWVGLERRLEALLALLEELLRVKL